LQTLANDATVAAVTGVFDLTRNETADQPPTLTPHTTQESPILPSTPSQVPVRKSIPTPHYTGAPPPALPDQSFIPDGLADNEALASMTLVQWPTPAMLIETVSGRLLLVSPLYGTYHYAILPNTLLVEVKKWCTDEQLDEKHAIELITTERLYPEHRHFSDVVREHLADITATILRGWFRQFTDASATKLTTNFR